MGDIVQIDPSEPPIYCPPEEDTCGPEGGCPEGTKPGNCIPGEFVGGGVSQGCRGGKPVDKLYSLGDNGKRYETYSDGGSLCFDCEGNEIPRTPGPCQMNTPPQLDVELFKMCVCGEDGKPTGETVLVEFCWVDGVKQPPTYSTTAGLPWDGDPATLCQCGVDYEYKWEVICIGEDPDCYEGIVCIEYINGIMCDPVKFKDQQLNDIEEPAVWKIGECDCKDPCDEEPYEIPGLFTGEVIKEECEPCEQAGEEEEEYIVPGLFTGDISVKSEDCE